MSLFHEYKAKNIWEKDSEKEIGLYEERRGGSEKLYEEERGGTEQGSDGI